METKIPKLFESLSIRSIVLRNRIVVSPMCQYSCDQQDGVPLSWHMTHLPARAIGCGMVVCEATAVEPNGRISLKCPGLWNEKQVEAWRPLVREIERHGALPCIQLAHAGRKAGTREPWVKNLPLYYKESELEGQELRNISCSPIAFRDGWKVPREMTVCDIKQQIDFWKSAALRARDAGFKAIELHFAHGYLVSEFCSPLSNKRSDEYGGSFENRIRFGVEIATAVRSVFPASLPIFARINGSDWADGSWDVDDAALFAKKLHEVGVDMIDVSSGGNIANAKYSPVENSLQQGYQVPFAKKVKEANPNLIVAAVGMIQTPQYANEVIESGIDLVMIGRAYLKDPYFALRCARELNYEAGEIWPPQYDDRIGATSGLRKNKYSKL